MADKTVSLRINGVTITLAFAPEKTAIQYAGEFMAAFAPFFPTFTFSISPGGNLMVSAPEGVALSITGYGDGFVPVVSVKSDAAKEAPPVVIVVNSGVAGQTYRVSLNGTAFTYTTGTVDKPDTWYVEAVAEDLRTKIAAAGYIVQRFANVLVVRGSDGKSVSFAVSDTWNNKAIAAYRGRVGSEAELPPWLDEGTVLAVGDTKDGGYYVRYAYRDRDTGAKLTPTTVAHTGWAAVESIATGVYEETYLPGARTRLMPDSMPHVLVREANGSFTFKQASWLERQVGDEVSVPAPSFAGKCINDVFFFRNRLAVLTDDTLVFSKAGKFFDFWPDTAKQVLDTDPIDVTVGSERIAKLKHAVPFNTNTLLFGETSQFIVTAQGALTPRTLSVQPTTNFEVSTNVRPIALGQTVYYVADKTNWSSVWEYYVQDGSFVNTAQELTQHVPRYIPAGVYQLAGSASENMVIGLSARDRKTLYVYQYLWSGDKKVQSSWGQWTFGGEVINCAFMGSKLYLAFKHSGEGIFLERMDLQEAMGSYLVDRKGHANWKGYQMAYKFSPVQLRSGNGADFGALRKLRTLKVNHAGLSWLNVGVANKGRAPGWRLFPDAARSEVFRGSQAYGSITVGLSGNAEDTQVMLVNNSNMQTVIRSVEFELTNDMRARRV